MQLELVDHFQAANQQPIHTMVAVPSNIYTKEHKTRLKYIQMMQELHRNSHHLVKWCYFLWQRLSMTFFGKNYRWFYNSWLLLFTFGVFMSTDTGFNKVKHMHSGICLVKCISNYMINILTFEHINNNSTTRENKLALLPTSKYSASITSSSNMNNLNDYEHFNYRPSPRSSYLNQHLAYNHINLTR